MEETPFSHSLIKGCNHAYCSITFHNALKSMPVLPRKPSHRMMDSLGMTSVFELVRVPLLELAPWLPDLSFVSRT